MKYGYIKLICWFVGRKGANYAVYDVEGMDESLMNLGLYSRVLLVIICDMHSIKKQCWLSRVKKEGETNQPISRQLLSPPYPPDSKTQ